MKDIIPRINELAKKEKSLGLSQDEKIEQKQLREQYIQRFRGNLENTLMGVKVIDKDGKDVTPEKLRKEQKKRLNN